jgi:Na+-driven multidrug efflux pump
VLIALLNALLNYFAIQQWGTIGAAQATLATYVIGFLASQYILNKQIGVQTWQVVHRISSSYSMIFNMLKKIR